MKKKTKAKVTFAQADEIRMLSANGVTLAEISKEFGISIPYASLIARNLRKKRRPANVAA